MLKEAMYKAFFEELNEIEKVQQFEKSALNVGALKGLGTSARQILGAGKAALKDPTAAGKLVKGTYQRAGGGLSGVGKVLDTPIGRAAVIGGGTALAAPAAAGYVAGRQSRPQGYYR